MYHRLKRALIHLGRIARQPFHDESMAFATDVKVPKSDHAPTAVTTGLRSRGVDVVTSQGTGLLAASDEEHLTQAAEGRVIFTQDADLERLHAKGRSHAGIVYAHQQTPIGDVIGGLMLIHRVLGPRDMHNPVEFL